MTAFGSNSSRLVKVGARLAQGALWLLALAWLLLGVVWAGLHFLIVPRIADFRPLLEAQASQAIGATVRIGAIAVQSNGLIPSFALTDITLRDAQGREALNLPLVVVALSPRSLLGLGFEQLYIERPVLDVRRSADGQIWVAGFALPRSDTAGNAGAEWVFSQPEIAIRHGTVHWTDAQRDAPTLTLTEVDLVLRNAHRGHAVRLDASPPAEWGERLGLSAVFEQPLLTGSAGRWRDWDGELHADFGRVDLARLSRYVDVGIDVAQGAGVLRAWVDVRRAVVTGATADVALTDVNATVEKRLEPLALRQVVGRLGVRRLPGGMEYSTEGLQFETQDGLHWPGGNLRIALFPADARNPARGELVADRLDLAAMAQIAKRLSLGDSVHTLVSSMNPKGLVERVQGNWRDYGAPQAEFSARGRVVGLELASEGGGVDRPGVRGADIDFDFNQSGGKAALAMRNGQLDFPGIFEEPQLPIDQLQGDVQWKRDGEKIQVSLPNLRFGNADAEGEAQLKWQTGEAARPFPGVLDLQGSLSRAAAGRVHRYLPLPIDKDVREYVRTAIPSGSASGVKFRVKGRLLDFPFETAKDGDFRISTNLKDVLYDYAPASVRAPNSLPWPALTQASGELVVDRSVLQVTLTRAHLAGGPGLRVGKVEGLVSHLYGGATVDVSAELQGPLAEALAVVNASPLGDITGKALAQTTATGVADYRFRLGFPIAAVEKTTVYGTVVLGGNDLQIIPETPRLSRARGTVVFSQDGFSVTGGQARALGGEVRIEGGLNTATSGVAGAGRAAMPTTLRLQGTATAEGLQQARELGIAARLGQYASGAAAYAVVLGLRAGTPELQISSNLAGMALRLPPPFAKTAESVLPLRIETSVLRTAPKSGGEGLVATQDQLQLDVGSLLNLVYVRDVTGPHPRVVRGTIAVGLGTDETAPMPDNGVVANIYASGLDLDAWNTVLSQASGADPAAGSGSAPVASASADMAYLPTTMALRAKELTVGGRRFNNVVVGAGREGQLWRANLDASEINGYVEYRQPSGATPGRLYGRLARLVIAPSAAQDVENILDEQPASIPALDIVVEDFELRGKKLGRVEMDAVNLAAGGVREWRLNRFNIITPEAVLTASGNWANVGAQAARSATRSIKDRRRTVLNFKLAIADSGELLTRFGMKGVIRKGSGKIEGQVAWQGSPITLDYPSLGGNLNVNVEGGQFLKAEPGIAKLLGVLSLQSLPRRLVLDFRDVFSEGFSFDFLRGDVAIEQGIASTSNLQMKGVNAVVLMEGQADIAKETQSIKVVVVPEINAGSASLLASIVNPVMGLSTFLAQAILRRPLIEAATQEFLIDGTWVDPRVTKINHKTGKPEASP